MRKWTLLVSIVTLGAGLVLADAKAVRSGDDLVQTWAAANTPRKRQDAMTRSYLALRKLVRAQASDDIATAVRILGAMYARDYDPHGDTVAMFSARLKEPDFRRIFDDEVARLPGDQRQKLGEAVRDLADQPECTYRGKELICDEEAAPAK